MARPNNAAATGEYVRGLREAKAAFQALPAISQEILLNVTQMTVSEIKRLAQARILASPSVRTKALYNSIAWTINKNSGRGRVGVTSGSTTGFFAAGTGVAGELKRRTIKGVVTKVRGRQVLIKPSRYAHLVEFGRQGVKAEPFMIPAAEAQKQPFLDRVRAAGPTIETKMAQIGTGSHTL